MVGRKEHTPEALAQARHLYENTPTPVAHIATMLDVARSTVTRYARSGHWQRHRAAGPAPADLEPAVTPEQARAALVARIQRIAEREMDAVERVLDAFGPAENADADRTARTLAGISRTLREIVALTTRETVVPAHDPNDDSIPVDIDALRCELARRINALIDARAEQAVGDRDGGPRSAEGAS